MQCIGLRGARRRRLLAAACAVACGSVAAQEMPRQIAFEPSASVTQTFSDNYNLSSIRPEGDSISRLTAGIAMRARSGLLRGSVDYSLSGLLHARHSGRNELQNNLNGRLSAELVDNRLQLEAAANISRTALSAFGVQPGGGGDANANSAELRTLSLTPRLQGPLGPGLRYTASLGTQVSRASGTALGNSTTTSLLARLEPTERAVLAWSADLLRQDSSYRDGRSSQSERAFGRALLSLDDLDLQVSASVGMERTNLISLDSRSYNTWGVGLRWIPSPVTTVSADVENRFFGRSYALSMEHRTPRTVWRWQSARDLSTSGAQQVGVQGQAYNLLFAQLASAQPDPVLRDVLVRRLLQQQNIDPNRIITAGFLVSAATVQTRHEFSAAWTGPRNFATLSLARLTAQRVDSLSSALDDLAGSDSVAQTSLNANLSHRLTPLSAVSLVLSVQQSRGQRAVQSSRQALAELQYSTRLTPDSNAGLAFRHARYKTALVPYDENAITASYGMRF